MRPKAKPPSSMMTTPAGLAGESYYSTPGSGVQSDATESADTLNDLQLKRIIWESNYISGLISNKRENQQDKRKDHN